MPVEAQSNRERRGAVCSNCNPCGKALIHRNVPGEPVHELLALLDRHWQYNAGLASYGPVQRWLATVEGVRGEGWPVIGGRTRWRLGELTVPWESVLPNGFSWA